MIEEQKNKEELNQENLENEEIQNEEQQNDFTEKKSLGSRKGMIALLFILIVLMLYGFLHSAFNSDKISLPLKESINHISSEFLMAYPPGIPVLCPGEIITKEIIDYVEDLKRVGLYVQGTEDPSVENIKVVK